MELNDRPRSPVRAKQYTAATTEMTLHIEIIWAVQAKVKLRKSNLLHFNLAYAIFTLWLLHPAKLGSVVVPFRRTRSVVVRARVRNLLLSAIRLIDSFPSAEHIHRKNALRSFGI